MAIFTSSVHHIVVFFSTLILLVPSISLALLFTAFLKLVHSSSTPPKTASSSILMEFIFSLYASAIPSSLNLSVAYLSLMIALIFRGFISLNLTITSLWYTLYVSYYLTVVHYYQVNH